MANNDTEINHKIGEVFELLTKIIGKGQNSAEGFREVTARIIYKTINCLKNHLENNREELTWNHPYAEIRIQVPLDESVEGLNLFSIKETDLQSEWKPGPIFNQRYVLSRLTQIFIQTTLQSD